MECCDITGDTDFDCFIPNFGGRDPTISLYNAANNPARFGGFRSYNDENEELLFESQLSKVRPLLDDSSDWDDNGVSGGGGGWRDGVQLETSLSQEFPPVYPQIERPDPFMFLKSRSRGKTASSSRTGKRGKTTLSTVESKNALTPTECCNHDEPAGNRKYLVNFDRHHSSDNISDQCYAAEKDRCMQFWNFVNETPELQNVIKEGRFEHSSRPHCLLPEHPSKGKVSTKKDKKGSTTTRTTPKYTPEMKALRQRNERVFKEIRDLHQRNHERVTNARRKSGQLRDSVLPQFHRKKTPAISTICHYADCATRPVTEVMAEMELFDDLSHNPVKTACARRKIECKPEKEEGNADEEEEGEFYGEGYEEYGRELSGMQWDRDDSLLSQSQSTLGIDYSDSTTYFSETVLGIGDDDDDENSQTR